MSMFTCKTCGAQSWNPFTDGQCDNCWERDKNEAEFTIWKAVRRNKRSKIRGIIEEIVSKRRLLAEKALLAVIILITLTGLVWLLNVGAKRAAQVSCYELKQQAIKYPQFWITESQSRECEALQIETGARVYSTYETN